MEGFAVGGDNLIVTLLTHLEIVRWPFLPAAVSEILVGFRVIAFVAVGATPLEVLVRLDQLPVDQKSPVILFRLNWRRRPCSPFRLACVYLRQFAQRFQGGLIGMTGHTAALVFRRCCRGYEKKKKGTGEKDGQDDDSALHKSSRAEDSTDLMIQEWTRVSKNFNPAEKKNSGR